MYFIRDENGKVKAWGAPGNELRDLPRKVDLIFRETTKELANTRVEITIKNIKEKGDHQHEV